MFFNYKPVMENDEPIPDDGLEVTKAINAQAAKSLDTPEQIAIVSDQIAEAAKKEEESTDEVGVDQSSDNLDADPDNAEDIDNSIEETSTNIEEASQDASALEAILDQINKSEGGLSLEAYGVAYERLSAIRDKYDPRPKHFYNNERVLVVSTESISTIAAAIWKFIKEQLAKLKDLLVALYQMSQSKLKVATEDVKKYRKLIKEGKLEKPKKAVVTNPMFSSLTFVTIANNSPQDLMVMLLAMTDLIGNYNKHLSRDYPIFVKSVTDTFNQNVEPTVVQDASGKDALQLVVDTHISKTTLPSYVSIVGTPAIATAHTVDPDDVYLYSKTIPHGVKVQARICGDISKIGIVKQNDISDTIHFSSVQLIEVPNYTVPDPDVPVMTKPMFNLYLNNIENFIIHLHTSEYFVKNMVKDLGVIEKLLTTEQSQLKTLKDLNNGTPEEIVKYREGRARLLNKLISLMNSFFISMNKRMMLLGNSYLAASLKYSNAVCAQYTGEPEEKSV